jgi:dienelactone hydrolase
MADQNLRTDRRNFLITAATLATSSAGLLLPHQLSGAEPGKRLVDRDIRDAADRAKLSMQFTGKTAEECRKWQKLFRAKLADLLGDFTPPQQWETVIEKTVRQPDHTRHELLLTAKGVPSVPVYLLIPKDDDTKKGPGVVCVHGHGNYGHHPIVGRTDLPGVGKAIQSAHYDYGLQFVRRGYVVAAPCMVPFGRRVDRDRYGKTDPCATTFVRMQALGQTTMGANLRDLMWCVDLLRKRKEVDGENIGCAGLSYGGRMTMLLAAMDQRVKIAAVSGAMNLLQERISLRYSCGSQIIPGLLKYGDYSEIGSLIAPRHCIWEMGSRDGLVVKKWDKVFQDRLSRAYKAMGVRERLKFDKFEGGHRWNGKVAYPLFDKVLKG